MSLLLSCSERTKVDRLNKSNLKLKESKIEINIPIDSKTSCETMCLQYFREKRNEYLAILNKYENAVQIYNIQDTLMCNKLKFDIRGGENATNKIKGFKIINKDTVFVTSFLYNIYLTNFDGEVYKKLNYWKPIGGIYPSYSYSSTTIDESFIYKAPYLYIAQSRISTKNPSVKFDPDINSKICLAFDTSSEELKFLEMNHSTFGQDGSVPTNTRYARIYNGNEFVYAPCGDHYMYVTKDHQRIISKKVKSQFLTEKQFGILDNFKQNETIKRSQIMHAKAGFYLNILYDEERDMYYRIVKLPMNVRSKYNPDFDYTDYKISIMLLDNELNILDEIPLAEHIYNWRMAFVNKKGLWISTNNINNPNFSEDYLSFRLISINSETKL